MFPNYRTTQWHYNKISNLESQTSQINGGAEHECREEENQGLPQIVAKTWKEKKIGFGWLFLRYETFCGSLEAI
jgi:hypothetical protein